jgi:hypothetical protein
MFLNSTEIFLDFNKILGRYAKIRFFTKIIFCSIMAAWLSNHRMCKKRVKYLRDVNARKSAEKWP